MTIIAWDRHQVAADQQGNADGLKRRVLKLVVVDGVVLGISGEGSAFPRLIEWYKDGCDPADYPARQTSDQGSSLMLFTHHEAFYFSLSPIRSQIIDEFSATGSGRDYAIAAMHCGKSPAEAVEIASIYDVNCGMGCTVIQRSELK